MFFFLIAGAAVLEVHRLVTRKIHVGGDEELQQIKLRERSLKQALQVLCCFLNGAIPQIWNVLHKHSVISNQ